MAIKKKVESVDGNSRLMAGFRSRISKIKDKGASSQAECDVMYPTGFLALDYLNGTMVHVKTPTINTSYKSIGLMDGSSNTFIGRSNTGKSTFCIQIIGNILRSDPLATAVIDDIEGSLPMTRKEFLLGLSQEDLESRIDFRNTGITTENVYQRIRAIRDDKLENRSVMEYDTGLFDTYGNKIYKFHPTIYFIDSFAMLMPDDIVDNGEISGGMGASSIAKRNTELIKKISQLLKEANIILITINHILDDINMGFMPKPTQISGLKQGERLPGGKAALYLANNMFRLDTKGTLKAAEGYGVDGSIIDISIIKSRTNADKRSVPMIFDKSVGRFDNIISLFHYLKTEGKVGGAGSYLYLENLPDVKFAQKNFKAMLNTNPDLQRAFALLCKETLEELLSDTANMEVDNNDFDINSAILAME